MADDRLRAYCTWHNDTYPDIDPTQAQLSGRSVVITGASKGIGRATAVSFAKAGASPIAISARSDLTAVEADMRAAAKAANRPDPQVVRAAVDVTSEANVRDFAETVASAFGGQVDVLVNNAGFCEPWLPIVESDPATWWKTLDINVRGVYLCSRYILPLVLKSQLKTVLNVSSTAAPVVMADMSAYQASKVALCRMNEAMDVEHRKDGLVAISLHPGGVETELAKSVLPNHMYHLMQDTPELAGDFMVWLCWEKRDWLSGRFVNVNWDVKELESKKSSIEGTEKLTFQLVL